MKKFKALTFVFLLSALITGCNNSNDSNDVDTNTGTNVVNPPNVNEDNVIDTNAVDTGGDSIISEHIFALTPEDIYIYERFKEELSTSVFEGVDPFSIARIHIQAGLDGEWQVEYAMFNELGRYRTLEDWGMFFEEEMSQINREFLAIVANDTFGLMEYGIFIEDSDTEAHILFQSVHGDYLVFRFVKNNNGIWEVRYNPIDFVS